LAGFDDTEDGGRQLTAKRRILDLGAAMTVLGARAALSPAIGSWIAQWRGYGTAFIALGLLTVGAIVVWLTFAGLSRPFGAY
jgi:hypothetical protein